MLKKFNNLVSFTCLDFFIKELGTEKKLPLMSRYGIMFDVLEGRG
jgi:hypothetical protein